jgi:cytoskeleton-associated protein 5
LDRYESNRASREIGYQRARSYMTSPSEEKENGGFDVGKARGGGGQGGGSGGSPARFSRDRDISDSGSRGESVGMSASAATLVADGNGDGGNGGQPIESWRRAAEVTSQLKARIEQMKVSASLTWHAHPIPSQSRTNAVSQARQGLGRQH